MYCICGNHIEDGEELCRECRQVIGETEQDDKYWYMNTEQKKYKPDYELNRLEFK